LVQMTGKAVTVGPRRLCLCRINNVRRGHRLGMLASWAVTRFTCLRGPAPFLVGFHQLVRTLLE
jgi:hypothetical protein